ncbi:CBS domain-containing protein [Amycolatopsis cihanbeyliensis]|uniref:CBS domain protein n=1 Tax=Amycolatopsis cihanbeyliensis TaxID=1128664 RepID=A0A542DE09_AMYCI|nr:CBS domain-containing protein [Amycolatopsis cihanbeyliensis]TQJ01302.1 CBS domain protein [Amycolatopsis cihanbeyliensis]
MRVREVMSTPVVTVTADCPARRAAGLLAHYGYTALPVVDEGEGLVGIVTEADLMRDRFARDRTLPPAPPEQHPPAPGTVGETMTAPALAVGTESDVADLVRLMLDEHVRSVPVVDGTRVRGIVTRRDLVRALGREDEALTRDIRRRLAFFGGPDRWHVEVRDGEATIVDEFDSEIDRRVATVLAEGVVGVLRARCVAATASEGAGR